MLVHVVPTQPYQPQQPQSQTHPPINANPLKNLLLPYSTYPTRPPQRLPHITTAEEENPQQEEAIHASILPPLLTIITATTTTAIPPPHAPPTRLSNQARPMSQRPTSLASGSPSPKAQQIRSSARKQQAQQVPTLRPGAYATPRRVTGWMREFFFFFSGGGGGGGGVCWGAERASEDGLSGLVLALGRKYGGGGRRDGGGRGCGQQAVDQGWGWGGPHGCVGVVENEGSWLVGRHMWWCCYV